LVYQYIPNNLNTIPLKDSFLILLAMRGIFSHSRDVMKNLTFKADAKFPSGIIAQGTTIQVDQFYSAGILFTHNGVRRRILWQVAHKYFACFSKCPTLATLERWSNDGRCKTPAGKTVEPDGIDENGIPSWLMILGWV
jgi:hypothetical protein